MRSKHQRICKQSCPPYEDVIELVSYPHFRQVIIIATGQNLLKGGGGLLFFFQCDIVSLRST